MVAVATVTFRATPAATADPLTVAAANRSGTPLCHPYATAAEPAVEEPTLRHNAAVVPARADLLAVGATFRAPPVAVPTAHELEVLTAAFRAVPELAPVAVQRADATTTFRAVALADPVAVAVPVSALIVGADCGSSRIGTTYS
jgi:hypothetical protein